MRILNSELADTLGNLLSRCTGSVLNPRQTFPKISKTALAEIRQNDVTKQLLTTLETLPNICNEHYANYSFYRVADSVVATLHKANLFFETLKPWELKKTQQAEKLDVVIHLTLETLRISAILLQPLIPNIATKLLDKLSVKENERTFENAKNFAWNDSEFKERHLAAEKFVLFKRIEDKSKVRVSGK